MTIKRKAKGILVTGSLRGDKFIPYDHIVAVQLKRPGVTVGYLQLSVRAGSEAKGGLTEAMTDENTVTFVRRKLLPEFEEARNLILQRAGHL